MFTLDTKSGSDINPDLIEDNLKLNLLELIYLKKKNEINIYCS